jgi:hypoxanthine phosphoribosyltransferase
MELQCTALKIKVQAVFSHLNKKMYLQARDVSTGFCGLHRVRHHNSDFSGRNLRTRPNHQMLEILGFIIGVVGLVVSIYYGVKSKELEKRISRFTWDDIVDASEHIYKKGILDFQPDFILTVSMPGLIVASFVAARKGSYLPVLSSRPYIKGKAPSNLKNSVQTSKWTIDLPPEIADLQGSKILVIDGAALTGDTLEAVTAHLLKAGAQRSKIRWATILTTEMAIEAGKSPEIFRFKVQDSNVFLPWGKVLGPGL